MLGDDNFRGIMDKDYSDAEGLPAIDHLARDGPSYRQAWSLGLEHAPANTITIYCPPSGTSVPAEAAASLRRSLSCERNRCIQANSIYHFLSSSLVFYKHCAHRTCSSSIFVCFRTLLKLIPVINENKLAYKKKKKKKGRQRQTQC